MRVNIVSFFNSILSRHFEKKNSIDRLYKSVYMERYFKRNKRHRFVERTSRRLSDVINRHVYASVFIMFIGVPSMIVASVVVLATAIITPVILLTSM